MSRLFVKSAEHTWGEDVKTWLNDTTNWSNEDFAAVRDSESNFLTIQQSWVEQRNWSVNYPVSALGAGMQRDIQAARDKATAEVEKTWGRKEALLHWDDNMPN